MTSYLLGALTSIVSMVLGAFLFRPHLKCLGVIVANQDTLNTVATELGNTAAALAELVPALAAAVNAEEPPLDFSALETVTTQIQESVNTLIGLLPPAAPAEPEVTV